MRQPKDQWGLTATDRQIIDLMCQGFSTRQMATKMELTNATIESYRTRMNIRFGVSSGYALIAKLFREGALT